MKYGTWASGVNKSTQEENGRLLHSNRREEGEGMLSSAPTIEQMGKLMPRYANSLSKNHTINRIKEITWTSWFTFPNQWNTSAEQKVSLMSTHDW